MKTYLIKEALWDSCFAMFDFQVIQQYQQLKMNHYSPQYKVLKYKIVSFFDKEPISDLNSQIFSTHSATGWSICGT